MAVTLLTGAELSNDISSDPYFGAGGTTPTASTANPHRPGGQGGLRHFRAAAATTGLSYLASVNTWATLRYIKGAFSVSALPTNTAPRIMWVTENSGGADRGGIALTSAGNLRLLNASGTQIGSDSTFTVTTGVYFTAVLSLDPTNGAIAGYVGSDGQTPTQFASGTTTTPTTPLINLGWFSAPGNASTTNLDIDDIIWDSAAPPHANVCVFFHKPVSDNARVGWTAGGGGTTNLWQAVSNVPPTGSGTPTNTSQITDSAANTTDTYDANVESWLDKGISGTVVGTVACAIIGDSAAGNNTVGLQVLSNPVIAEATGTPGGVGALGTYPTGWNVLGGLVSTAAVTMTTEPVVRLRHGTSSGNTQSCQMGLLSAVQVGRSASPPINVIAAQARQRASSW